MPPNPTRIPPFQTCQLILDRNGVVRKCDEDTADRLCAPRRELEGHRLRDLLLAINPYWENLIPEQIQQIRSFIYLPWMDNKENEAAGGIKLHVLDADESIGVTIEPALAPFEELRHVSVMDLPSDALHAAQLFLRLQTTESRLENYLHNFPGIFFSQRADYSFSYLGPGFREAFGIDPKPLYRNGSRFLDLILEQDRENFIHDTREYAKTPTVFNTTYRLRSPKDGRVRYVMDARTPRLSPSGLILGYDGVWLDITRQAIAEDRLTRTAWKESLATLTKGLIHDFSNVMAGIYSLSELYCADLAEDHPWHSGMTQIMKNSLEARKLVRRVIDLNRETAGSSGYHDIVKLIKEQLDLLKVVMPKNVKLECNLTDEELPVFLDDVSFRQMMVNFAMNSRDAIMNDGRITITVYKAEEGARLFENSATGTYTAEREGVVIEFQDNGSGIEQQHLEKIFDPFFTTKDVGKGSGFGLYTSRLFVKSCRGMITATSIPEKGTTMQVFLPLTDFTEILDEEDQVEIEAGSPLNPPPPRRKVAVYASNDPGQFEIVSHMREHEWEIITFQDAHALHRYLDEALFPPELVLVIAIGEDPQVNELIEHACVPAASRLCALQIIGSNPHAIPQTVRKSVDLICDDSMMSGEFFQELNQLMDTATVK